MPTEITIYVVYANPSDFPGKYVGRKHWVRPDGVTVSPEPFAVADTLDEVRKEVPEWLVRMDRQPDDDAAICEVWF